MFASGFRTHVLTHITIDAKRNTTAEIITHTIQDIRSRRYYIDEYSPEEYCELSVYGEIDVDVNTAIAVR